jgi:hypothetical protein
MKSHDVTIRITNTTADTLMFVLEPWGEVYDFAPGSKMVVKFSADREGEPEIVLGERAVEVYGWTGCTAIVELNGETPEQIDTSVASGWAPSVESSTRTRKAAKKPSSSIRRRAS